MEICLSILQPCEELSWHECRHGRCKPNCSRGHTLASRISAICGFRPPSLPPDELAQVGSAPRLADLLICVGPCDRDAPQLLSPPPLLAQTPRTTLCCLAQGLLPPGLASSKHGACDRAQDRQVDADAAEPPALREAIPLMGPLITSYHPAGASTARHPLRGMMLRRLTEEQKKRDTRNSPCVRQQQGSPVSPNVHIWHRRFKHHQNSTRRPPEKERKKKSENGGGRGKNDEMGCPGGGTRGGAPKGGPRRFWPQTVGPPKGEGPKFRAFSPLSRHNFLFFLPLLGVVSLNFGGVIELRDPQMCTFGFSDSCAPAAQTTRHEQQIVPKNSPIGHVFWGQGWFSKVWAQNGLIKKRGQEAVWANSGQKWCGPKVARKNRKHGNKSKNLSPPSSQTKKSTTK